MKDYNDEFEKEFATEKRKCGDCKNFKLDRGANVLGICIPKLMTVISRMNVTYRKSEGTCFEPKDMEYSKLLVAIIAANPQIEITCPNVSDIVREVLADTGVMIRSNQVFDIYYIERYNRYYDEMEDIPRKRLDRRSFKLYINE